MAVRDATVYTSLAAIQGTLPPHAVAGLGTDAIGSEDAGAYQDLSTGPHGTRVFFQQGLPGISCVRIGA